MAWRGVAGDAAGPGHVLNWQAEPSRIALAAGRWLLAAWRGTARVRRGGMAGLARRLAVRSAPHAAISNAWRGEGATRGAPLAWRGVAWPGHTPGEFERTLETSAGLRLSRRRGVGGSNKGNKKHPFSGRSVNPKSGNGNAVPISHIKLIFRHVESAHVYPIHFPLSFFPQRKSF